MKRRFTATLVTALGLALGLAEACSGGTQQTQTNAASSGRTPDISEAIIHDPKGAEGYIVRGKAYARKGKLDLALADCTKAIELAPTNAEAYSQRSSVYLGLASAGVNWRSTNAHLAQSRLDQALADCNTAIGLAPGNAAIYGQRGVILAFAGRYDAGATDQRRAIELDPDNPMRYSVRAQFYRLWSSSAQMMGNDDLAAAKDRLALQDYNKVVELAPRAADSYLARADFYAATDWNLALADLNKAIALAPSNAFPHRILAAKYEARDETALARAEYDKAITVDPTDAVSYSDRGSFHAAHSNHDLALADLNKSVELDPNQANAFANRAEVYAKEGKMRLALADWDKAVELRPDSGYYRSQRDRCAVKAQTALGNP